MDQERLIEILKELELLDIGDKEQYRQWCALLDEIGKHFHFPIKFIFGNKFYTIGKLYFSVEKADIVIRRGP